MQKLQVDDDDDNDENDDDDDNDNDDDDNETMTSGKPQVGLSGFEGSNSVATSMNDG